MSSVRFGAVHVLGTHALHQFTHRLSVIDHTTGGRDSEAISRQNHQDLLGRYIDDPAIAAGNYVVAATGTLADANRELIVMTGPEMADFKRQLAGFPGLKTDIAKGILYQAEANGPLPRIDILS